MNTQFTPAWRLRKWVASAVLPLAAALAVLSCSDPGANPDGSSGTLSGQVPPGYALRLDRENRDPVDFVATADDGGLQVQTGPAGILYRPDQAVDAERYAVRAQFVEIGAPVGHQEGFGLFVGGQELEAASQRYLYFIVRSDGHYLIKQREGDSTREISNGWQPSKAVRLPTSDQEAVNDLAIAVDGGQVRFSCNGEQVADMPVGDIATKGVVGVRVNHNLRVRIRGFRVEL